MAYEININPLDLQTDTAIGVLLNTTHPSGKIFLSSYTTLDQAKSNAINLILTNEGERIMHPNFGCSIKRMLFEPITPSLIQRMDRTIREKMAYWLPYINIKELNIEAQPDQNQITFKMDFAMQGNDFDRSTITFQLELP